MAKPSEPAARIPDDVVRFAQSQVSAGRFASVDDVLRAGVEAIQQREAAAEDWLAYARDAWSRGVQSLDAGKAVLTTDEEFEAFLDDCVPRLCAVSTLTGRVHGNTIDLDAVPSAPFEGKRVRVVLELVDDDVSLEPTEHGLAWNAWVTPGPDGSIEDDGEPEFPR